MAAYWRFGRFLQPPLQRIDLVLELVMLLLQRVQLGVERRHMGLDRIWGLLPGLRRKGKRPSRVVGVRLRCHCHAVHQGCPPLWMKFASPYRHGRLRRQGEHGDAHE